MSLPIVINSLADEDLVEARGYYESRRAGLGDGFLEQVRAALTLIRAWFKPG